MEKTRKTNRNLLHRIARPVLSVLFLAAAICSLKADTFAASQSGYVKYEMSSPSESGYSSISYNSGQSTVGFDPLLKKSAAIPSKYDARTKGIVTSVKDQNRFGSCWAFSAISISETSLIKEFPKDFTLENTDLSEVHHAYFTFAKATDALGLTKGDYSDLSNGNCLDVGGNLYFSTFTLARWFGVADESVAPYNKVFLRAKLDPALSCSKNLAILENAYWVSMKDSNTIKTLVMKYGSCAISYYQDDRYLNSQTGGYYQQTYTAGNHSATLVGWDDNYSKDKFGGILGVGRKPTKNGAWLVKNSYGKDYAKSGYVWISYEDPSLFNDDAVFFDFAKTDKYDNNYQYDGSCSYASYYYKDKIYSSNIFTAQDKEWLKAISFFTATSGITCKYQIYTDLKDPNNPSSGKPAFSSYVTCTPTYAGYHTVPLQKSIKLEKGKKFAVVIYMADKGKKVYSMCDYSGYVDADHTIYNHTYSEKGQSFMSKDGKSWIDLYLNGNNENFRIKAFTTEIYYPPQKLKANTDSIKLAPGSTFRATLTASPKNTSNEAVWSSSDKSVAKVSSNGKITAVAYGKAVISFKAKKGSNAGGQITVTVAPPAVKNLKQAAVGNDSYTITWSPQRNVTGYMVYKYNAKTKEKVLVATTDRCKYTRTGVSGAKDKYYVAAYIDVRTDSESSIKTKTYISPCTGIKVVTKPPKVSLSVKKVTADSVTLKWTSSKNADIYYVYRYDPNKKEYKTVSKTKSTSVTIKKLSANKSYKFCVRPKVSNGVSTYAGESSNIIVAKTLPSKVTGLKASASENAAKLKWKAVSGAEGYEIYIKKPGSEKYILLKTSSSSSLTVKKLKSGSSYRFRVRAYRIDGKDKVCGGYSDSVGVKIK